MYIWELRAYEMSGFIYFSHFFLFHESFWFFLFFKQNFCSQCLSTNKTGQLSEDPHSRRTQISGGRNTAPAAVAAAANTPKWYEMLNYHWMVVLVSSGPFEWFCEPQRRRLSGRAGHGQDEDLNGSGNFPHSSAIVLLMATFHSVNMLWNSPNFAKQVRISNAVH